MEKELDLILDEYSEGNMNLTTLRTKLLLLFNVSRNIKADDEKEIIDAYMKETKKFYPKKKQIRF